MISVPNNAKQHITAGPYAPVLEVTNFSKIVVISGQAAIDMEGNVTGTTIEEQTIQTLKNCEIQLANAGCTFKDVFKVNAYMKDLKDWPKFNEVYKQFISEPYPVRAVVGTALLETFLVEIEMWAAKEN